MKKLRFTALFLAIIMAFSCVVTTMAFAADASQQIEETDDGSYTAAPYMLRTESVDASKNIVKAWLELSPAIAESIASFQIALQLKTSEGICVAGRDLSFKFDKALDAAKVKEAQFDKEAQTLRLYVAGTVNLVNTSSDEDGNISNILPLGNITVEAIRDVVSNPFKIVLCGKTGDLVTVGLDCVRKSAAEVYGQNDPDYYIPVDGTVYSAPAPDDPGQPGSSNCSCICHKTGIMNFFYKIALFFWRLFGINQQCSCKVAHY